MKETVDGRCGEAINAKESDGAEIVIVFSVLNGQNGYGLQKEAEREIGRKEKGERGG